MKVDEKQNIITQAKYDALSAAHLHSQAKERLQNWNRFVDGLSLIVPTLYLTPQLLAKGTDSAKVIDTIGLLLAMLVLGATLLKLVSKWQDNEVRHLFQQRRNLDVGREADRLLGQRAVSDETFDQFRKRVQEIDVDDSDLLGTVPEKSRQSAYREALKKGASAQANVTCPKCGASPWDFVPGACGVCGGKPQKRYSSVP
jgi:mobilome CxxCx(11)CxxC protein